MKRHALKWTKAKKKDALFILALGQSTEDK